MPCRHPFYRQTPEGKTCSTCGDLVTPHPADSGRFHAGYADPYDRTMDDVKGMGRSPTPPDDTISDGLGSTWSATCPACERKSMEVVRPGKAQCGECGPAEDECSHRWETGIPGIGGSTWEYCKDCGIVTSGENIRFHREPCSDNVMTDEGTLSETDIRSTGPCKNCTEPSEQRNDSEKPLPFWKRKRSESIGEIGDGIAIVSGERAAKGAFWSQYIEDRIRELEEQEKEFRRELLGFLEEEAKGTRIDGQKFRAEWIKSLKSKYF